MSLLSAWDIVQILRVTNVKWRSGPKGVAASPHGNWVIAGFVGSEALLAKDGTIIRIPTSDIKRVGAYSIPDVLEHVSNVGKPDQTIDMVDIVSRQFGWDHQRARTFLLKYNLPEKAQNDAHKRKLTARVQHLVQGGYDG